MFIRIELIRHVETKRILSDHADDDDDPSWPDNTSYSCMNVILLPNKGNICW